MNSMKNGKNQCYWLARRKDMNMKTISTKTSYQSFYNRCWNIGGDNPTEISILQDAALSAAEYSNSIMRVSCHRSPPSLTSNSRHRPTATGIRSNQVITVGVGTTQPNTPIDRRKTD